MDINDNSIASNESDEININQRYGEPEADIEWQAVEIEPVDEEQSFVRKSRK